MTSIPDNVTRDLCKRITGITFDDLNDGAIAAARQLFLDGVAVAFAGSQLEEPPVLLAEQAKEYGGAEQASVIGLGFKTSINQAALINGAAMHVLDYEAMWMPVNHQLSTCLPAILALAEHKRLPGREIAAAFVKGIEMMGRIRQASKQFDTRIHFFHFPAATGPMGSAVAAAHLLGLDADTLCHAFGIAASRAAGVWDNAGTHTKSTHCGLACANGLESALLASRGFTGNPKIFETPRGYVGAFFDINDFDWDHLLSYGEPLKVLDPGYAIKMYPSQYATHFIIDATLGTRAKVNDPEHIEELTLHAPPINYVDRPAPDSGLAGKFSFQYVAAAAWLDGDITMDSFTDERRFAPDMERMLDKVRYNKRDDISAVLGERYVEVEAKMKDGTSEITRSDGPPGCFGQDPIPPEKHLDKVRACLALKLTDAEIERVIEMGSRLETLSGEDIQELMSILSAA
ncbi:MAG: MmgE/PrpD family protein [Rhodospirillaceae bacterium]|jgi:2-methylcitrate dehydratase PrpD